ncbi:hypothetical protein PUW24_22660 [Paenibacillus urinalis]|uniref:Uncharacterized protein n=1 Tax=Paenibacillus urinalis TaxID=521520 RepID=A0ABY7X4N4_9BACL|nr:hypothetical protein [Paenibacillus urinalis]WDH96912.1 hypothetical protein PUW24_22660 [Paenibacillus urinalis]WDI00556.1 hypothetical protein PUW25_14815 [Paenibacillus urinalis]
MPKHEFVVESNTNDKNPCYINYSWDSDGKLHREGLTDEDHVSIDDEFIMYLHDSLKWLSCWNPSTKEACKGLNVHGVTIIEKQNLITFRGIIQAWVDLFGFAPEKIELKGSYTLDSKDECGEYEILLFIKEDLFTNLNKLIRIINKAHDEERCILHLGI